MPACRYDVCAVSRPAHPLAVALFPLVRVCQKRFAYDTLQTMRSRVCPPTAAADCAGAPGPEPPK